MRTTVNLDEDVAAAVDRLRKERGVGLSEAVNALVRRGLVTVDEGTRHRYEHRTFPLGLKIDISNIGEVLDYLDRLDDEEARRAR